MKPAEVKILEKQIADLEKNLEIHQAEQNANYRQLQDFQTVDAIRTQVILKEMRAKKKKIEELKATIAEKYKDLLQVRV